MLQIIAMDPAAVLTAALLALVGLVYFIICGARCVVITLCIICLAPIWPFIAIRLIGVGLVTFSDWATSGRHWTRPFTAIARHLESRLHP